MIKDPSFPFHNLIDLSSDPLAIIFRLLLKSIPFISSLCAYIFNNYCFLSKSVLIIVLSFDDVNIMLLAIQHMQ